MIPRPRPYVGKSACQSLRAQRRPTLADPASFAARLRLLFGTQICQHLGRRCPEALRPAVRAGHQHGTLERTQQQARLFREHITSDDRAFIERLDMFLLATVDAGGHPNCACKGGDPGLVRVLDEQTLAFPNYDGNGMYLSMGNVAATARVGLLFIDFENQKRLRVDGSASIEPATALLPAYPEAQFVARVAVRQVFPNCPRYIHKMTLVERSKFVPRAACGGADAGPDAGPGLEVHGLGLRCAAGCRPCARTREPLSAC